MGASNTTITPLSANEIQVGSSLNPIQEDFQTPTTVYLTIDSASCRFSDSFVIKRDYDYTGQGTELLYEHSKPFCTDTTEPPYPSLSSYDSLRWSVIRGTATLINPR